MRLAYLTSRMRFLGMTARLTRDGSGAEGEAKFRKITNVFTRMKILDAKVRSSGTSKLVIVDPPYLSTLAPIPILNMKDPDDYESAVQLQCGKRVTQIAEARAWLRRYGFESRDHDAGFRLLGVFKCDGKRVAFAVLDSRMVELYSIEGRLFLPLEEKARQLDVSRMTEKSEVEMTIDGFARKALQALDEVAPATSSAPLLRDLDVEPARAGTARARAQNDPFERGPVDFSDPRMAPPPEDMYPDELILSEGTPVPPEDGGPELLLGEPAWEPPNVPSKDAVVPRMCQNCGELYLHDTGSEQDIRLMRKCPTCLAKGL